MKMPKEILVYACDYDDGKPLFAVAHNVSEIPEEYDGNDIGVYVLNRTDQFSIGKQLLIKQNRKALKAK